MSLAITALRMEEPIDIKNRECVAKSYPSFFEDIESLKKHDGE
jgi:3-phosphoshikimate 1-carboxyvinyltransferase